MDGCDGLALVELPLEFGDPRSTVKCTVTSTPLSAVQVYRNPSCDQVRNFSFKAFSAATSSIFQNGGETEMALKSMSVAKLQDLRGKVDAAIAEKVATRRRELEVQLSELAHHDPHGSRGKARGHRPMGSVPPKYRNPNDPSQTWAGRGLQPLWLRDAVKSGKKLDSFLIVKTAKKR
jgi:DNA-binding protein H-NS